MSGLLQRLRQVDDAPESIAGRRVRNPDGHEAAERIESLETEVERLNADIETQRQWLSAQVGAAVERGRRAVQERDDYHRSVLARIRAALPGEEGTA